MSTIFFFKFIQIFFLSSTKFIFFRIQPNLFFFSFIFFFNSTIWVTWFHFSECLFASEDYQLSWTAYPHGEKNVCSLRTTTYIPSTGRTGQESWSMSFHVSTRYSIWSPTTSHLHVRSFWNRHLFWSAWQWPIKLYMYFLYFIVAYQ